MKLSILIPVRNEEIVIKKIIDQLEYELKNLPYEIIFINDFSTDDSSGIIKEITKTKEQISLYDNKKKGLGGAITEGINKAKGEAVCIMMCDLSDDIDDLKKYYNIIKDEQVDAVFGSRFIKGSKINYYPKKKLILNRIFNLATKLLFVSDYNDFTNAFKKCDLILTPTTPSPAFAVGEKEDDPIKMYLNDIFTVPASLAGIPGISIPFGTTKQKLPLGIQLLSKHFDEQGILDVGLYLEKNNE